MWKHDLTPLSQCLWTANRESKLSEVNNFQNELAKDNPALLAKIKYIFTSNNTAALCETVVTSVWIRTKKAQEREE